MDVTQTIGSTGQASDSEDFNSNSLFYFTMFSKAAVVKVNRFSAHADIYKMLIRHSDLLRERTTVANV